MYTISKRFKGIVPSHGLTQKWYFSDHRFLDAYFWFKIWGCLLRSHSGLRLIMIIYPKIFSIILGPIAGGGPWKSAFITSTHDKSGEIFNPIYPWKIGREIFIPSVPAKYGEVFSSLWPLPNWNRVFQPHHLLVYLYNIGWDCHLIIQEMS